MPRPIPRPRYRLGTAPSIAHSVPDGIVNRTRALYSPTTATVGLSYHEAVVQPRPIPRARTRTTGHIHRPMGAVQAAGDTATFPRFAAKTKFEETVEINEEGDIFEVPTLPQRSKMLPSTSSDPELANILARQRRKADERVVSEEFRRLEARVSSQPEDSSNGQKTSELDGIFERWRKQSDC